MSTDKRLAGLVDDASFSNYEDRQAGLGKSLSVRLAVPYGHDLEAAETTAEADAFTGCVIAMKARGHALFVQGSLSSSTRSGLVLHR